MTMLSCSFLSILPIFLWTLMLSLADTQRAPGFSNNIDPFTNATENTNVTLVGDHEPMIICFNRDTSGQQHLLTRGTCGASLDRLWRQPLGDMPQYFRAHRGIVREAALFSQSPCTIGIASESEGDMISLSIRSVFRTAERVLQRCNDQGRGGVEYLRGGGDQWVVFVMERTSSSGLRGTA